MTHFEKRVQLNKIIESQLPEFVLADFPKAIEFFKQYYISQEYQGGNSDLITNLDRYIRVDNLSPEVVVGETTLSSDIFENSTTITVSSTKGFPDEYGLLKINDEIITYTSKTETEFIGCVRGFSGVTGYDSQSVRYNTNVNTENVIFSETSATSHKQNDTVSNLSILFLQELYKKLKRTFTPGLEDSDFVSDLDVANFVKHARNFYQSKGIEESVKILFKVLYGVEATVLDLEDRLIKPSSANFVRREVIVAENISGDPFELQGQTIYRSTDSSTNASVSNVEIFTRNNRTYYRIELFVGYNDRDLIEGIFDVPGYSKVLEPSVIGSSIISVDSTIGFPESGTIISGTNTITYTSKSINQFFDCSGINSNISVGDAVRANDTIYGYANGDPTKRVDLRITGVLSELKTLSQINQINDNEKVLVKSLGEIIENPDENKSYKQSFANSWIYNTSTRHKISSIFGSTFTVLSKIDKSSLRVGDTVEVLMRNSNTVVAPNATISSINTLSNQVVLSNLFSFTASPTASYDIRRKLKKVNSAGIPLSLGNGSYISNVLNVYTDDNSEYGYIASHSLPEYDIVDEIVESTIPDGTSANLDSYDSVLQTYGTIKFSTNVKFIDGDEVVYTSLNPLTGLSSGERYFIKVVSPNAIQLYSSKSLLSGNSIVRFGPNPISSTHYFTLNRHKSRILGPNKILRKFPLQQNRASAKINERGFGSVGTLVDGVEITSPNSRNKIYYGPLKEFEVINGGKDYDVMNPPKIEISPGLGKTALIEPVISGSVKSIFVDPQTFNLNEVFSLSLIGGNGTGCFIEPVIDDIFREVEFDSRDINYGGGVDLDSDTISFLEPHNFTSGQIIIYNENGNNALDTGLFDDQNNIPTGKLVSGDEYIAEFINTSTIRLYNNQSDYVAGINTIGFSTTTNVTGIHKFRTIPDKTLRKVTVLSGGSGYQHRKLRVPSSGISTEFDTISVKNHGFSNGDIVEYSTTGDVISGLSTSNRYSILKLDSDQFRLINVGIAGTVTTDLTRSKYTKLNSVGTGYQIFKYPDIEVIVNVSLGSTFTNTFTFTPIVTGEIIDAYMYDAGVGYGSSVLNLHKKPTISLKNGKSAEMRPVISNGRIVDVNILSQGSEYFSIPEIIADDGKVGSGAILRPVINNGSITDIVIINGGIGYDPNTTKIYIEPRGSGALFDCRVRDLTVNDAKRFGEYSKLRTSKIFSNLYESDTENNLVYGIYGYSTDLASNYGDDGNNHSPIVGWAYDGNPIYGPYGYNDPNDIQSGVGILKTGYTLNSSSVQNRPTTFSNGFFIEDYKFDNSGVLDAHNGRYCKTPEFPNGVYAYFCGVTTSTTSNDLEPSYPYFIGNSFRSDFIQENKTLNQSYDFNSSNLVRNTFPYKINDKDADYDFLIESYEDYEQKTLINSTNRGEISDVKVIDGGTGYRIGERINFDYTGTSGIGLRAEISELEGKPIDSLATSIDSFENCVFEWDDENNVSAYKLEGFSPIVNNDTVLIGNTKRVFADNTGINTSLYSIKNLFGSKKVGFSTETVSLAATMSSYTVAGGVYQDIFVSNVPETISIGATATIVSDLGSEIVTILNNYNNGTLRIRRYGGTGVAHSLGSKFNLLGDRLSLPIKTSSFVSKRNDIVFFNTQQSVGIGTTTGGSSRGGEKTYNVGLTSQSIFVPCRTIYIENHPFKTGQKVTFTKSSKPGTNSLIVGNTPDQLNTFFLPDTFSRTSDVYIIDKGRDFIGLTTQVGLSTSSEGLFFYSDGSDDSSYKFETNFTQITGDIDRVTTVVSTASSHGLEIGDQIRLTLEPNTVVGLGSTAALTLALDPIDKKLLINPTGINSTGINTTNNTITFTNHGFKTGDKIHYNSIKVASGLSTGTYYVIEDSRNTFRLAETYYETLPEFENEVNIVGTGDTTHTFSLINPKIDVTKNSELRFNVGDPTLNGYNFKLFRDKDFKDEYVTSFDTQNFNVIGVGSVGFGTGTGYVSIRYSENVPSKLYYALEKSGFISTADKDVVNYSEINYIDSEYNGTYTISGVTTTSFTISPVKYPKVLNYSKDQFDILKYNTKSSSTLTGAISKVKITNKGYNFKQIPKFIDVDTTDGLNANIVAISTDVGTIRSFRIVDPGYDYPSDKTLRPEAIIPPRVTIDNFDTIKEIEIKFGGKNYITPPSLILVNNETNEIVDSTSLLAKAPNGSISEIEQISPIFGIKSDPHRIIAIDNSNGVGISSIITSNSGVATCTLNTPILGFSSAPFQTGDYIYVEGIDLVGGGTGYNSENYEYRFFQVQSYVNTSPAQLTYSLVDNSNIGLTTNPGIAKTFQSGYATIINSKNYPIIDVIKERSEFFINENIFVSVGTGYFETDLSIVSVEQDYVKITGTYDLKKGSKIKGKVSGAIADVIGIDENRSKFIIDYSSKKNIGWNDDIGKISEDYQVTPNNDYYQNLSYSIKSPITWDEFSNPVNGVLHPAGMKNFADVGIVSTTDVGTSIQASAYSIAVLDVVNEKRVDTINNFDNATDYDTKTNPDQSKFLRFENSKLSDYTQCRSNRVLIHDDISGRFSSKGFQDLFIEVEEIESTDTIVNYLIQIVDPDTFESQVSELILHTTNIDSTLFEKSTSFVGIGKTYAVERLGYFSAEVDTSARKTLLFTPVDPYDRDHDIKVLKKTFTNTNSGLGTETIGSINLIGSTVNGITTVGTANSEKTIVEFEDDKFNGLYAGLEILNTTTNQFNYVEAALDFDGTDTYISEYYFDDKMVPISDNFIGIVTAVYDSNAGIVSLRVGNGSTDSILNVRANVVGFGSTESGIGTTRFLVSGQPTGTEKSARYESTYGSGTSTVRFGTFNVDNVTSVTSLVRVSAGNTSAIHQVTFLTNKSDVVTVAGPFAPTNTVTGLGTFGGEISGTDFYVNFYPDAGFDAEVQAFNRVLYTESDFDNEPTTLEYGTINDDIFVTSFDGLNGSRINKVNFELKHNGTPIFVKKFNPSDTTKLDYVTGIFNIPNHFYNTGEELIYTPKSTFTGIGQSAMGIGSTENYLGIVTDRLPERVYPIVISPSKFKLATKRSYANSGIGVTFIDSGLGNIHELEMTKKLTKTLISLDGVVQQPLTFTPLQYQLENNNGTLVTGISTFNISGIASIQPRDILKIDNEYMKITEVGFSTNVGGNILGPINGIIQSGIGATFHTVSTIRASLGSTEATHTDGTNIQIYRGSYNIVGSDVWFTDPPKGNARLRRNQSNLPYTKASFSGRTFTRSNYDTNMIFDDLSDDFTGIGKTYTVNVQGINTTGIENGNGVVFINGIFQTPSTLNNAGNNYEFENDTVAGISSIVFTGITSTDGSYVLSDFDINQNQLPRGGLIVSLGSTPGLGYAPLIGAEVRAELDNSGSIIGIVGIGTTITGGSLGVSTASYNNQSGIIIIETDSAHGLSGGDRVKLSGLGFTCPTNPGITSFFPDQNPNQIDLSYDIVNILSDTEISVNVGPSTIQHNYIGFGTVYQYFTLNSGSGYRGPVSIGVTDLNHTGTAADISATVGIGGTLIFTINDGGSGYNEPVISIPQPSYDNLEVVGVSRLGVGATTDTGTNLLLNVTVGASATAPVGLGSTFFSVDSFKISRSGYGFKVGDVFTPVGLVTAKGLSQPISQFQLEVTEIFNDQFSSWSFGQMNYIDSIKFFQNGIRKRFPLFLNGDLVSFEVDSDNQLSSEIDLDSVLIIFVNGVIQTPGSAYTFNGGTSFIFTEAPDPEDKVDIFFYLGELGVDSIIVNVDETLKIGDNILVKKIPFDSSVNSQSRSRTIVDILGSDNIETDNYVGTGINETIYRPVDWIKQKKDLYIKGDVIYKTRDIYEPRVYPTAKIIGDVNTDSQMIFVDDAQFFDYEDSNYGINIDSFGGLIVGGSDPVSAAFTATVSNDGSISGVTITNTGFGYTTTTIPIKFAAPQRIGVGIGTTATGTATILNGAVSSVSVDNVGFGYTNTNPPNLIVEIPPAIKENIPNFKNVQGFSGIITGISTTTGSNGHPLALTFHYTVTTMADADDLLTDYPIYINNTTVGNGVTSVNSDDNALVGIGTTFLDNIYIVHQRFNVGPRGVVTCNVHSDSPIVGIATTGYTDIAAGIGTFQLGNISWGRIFNGSDLLQRSQPISIGVTGLTVDSGLSTFPTIQRRLFGFKNNGSIRTRSEI